MENNKTQNKGKAWVNTKKEKSTQPDFKGKGNFNGIEFEFAMWYNEPKTPQENATFSISFSEPYKKDDKPNQFNANKAFAISEANKMFRADIIKSYQDEQDLPY